MGVSVSRNLYTAEHGMLQHRDHLNNEGKGDDAAQEYTEGWRGYRICSHATEGITKECVA